MTEPRLINGRQLRALLGCSRNTVTRYIAEGIIPGPIPKTGKWDRKAVELALDRVSGIGTASRPNGKSPWAEAFKNGDRAA